MSAKVSGKVWELELDPIDKLVLLALSDHADHEGNNVRPGNDLLCAKTGLTQPTVTAKIKRLTEAGILDPQTGKTGRGNIREFSIVTDHIPRKQYFIEKEAKKVKAAHTFQKVKEASTLSVKVKTDEGEKVKTDNEKVKAGNEKVKADNSLHDKERARIEPSINLHETSGGNGDTPFDSFDISTAAAAYEETADEIQDALRKIFPAERQMSGRIGELTMFVLGLKAPASYVLAWPEWFRSRFNGQIANHFKFGDTFTILAEEGLGPDAWLNGSVGSRFVACCSGYLGKKPVPASIASRVTAIGHWLDDYVKAGSKEEWHQRNLTPTYFEEFWAFRFSGTGKPTPDSVMKYWSEFTTWLQRQTQ